MKAHSKRLGCSPLRAVCFFGAPVPAPAPVPVPVAAEAPVALGEVEQHAVESVGALLRERGVVAADHSGRRLQTAHNFETNVIGDRCPESAACGGQVASRPVAVTVAPSYLFGKVDTWRDFRIKQTCCSGVGVGGHVGLRVLDDLTFGLQLSMAALDGYYLVDFNRTRVPMHVNPMNVAAGLHVTPYERYWGTLFLGAHFNRATIPSTRPDPVEEYAWHHGLAVGLQLGADLFRARCNGFGVSAWFSGGLGSENGYGDVGMGLSYRYSRSHH